jgi:hypothetical protein
VTIERPLKRTRETVDDEEGEDRGEKRHRAFDFY